MGEANLALGRHEERRARLKSRSSSNRVTNPIPMRWPGWSSTKKLQTKKLQLTKKLQPPGERFRIHPALTSRRPPRLLLRLVLLILLRRAQLCRHPTRHPPGSAPPKAPPLGAACEQLRISVGAFNTAYEQTVSETNALRAEATSLGTRVATLEARCVLTHTIPAAFTVSIA